MMGLMTVDMLLLEEFSCSSPPGIKPSLKGEPPFSTPNEMLMREATMLLLKPRSKEPTDPSTLLLS